MRLDVTRTTGDNPARQREPARRSSAAEVRPRLFQRAYRTPGTASSAPARTATPRAPRADQRKLSSAGFGAGRPRGRRSAARDSARHHFSTVAACRASRAGFSGELGEPAVERRQVARQVRRAAPTASPGRIPGRRARRAARALRRRAGPCAGGDAADPLRQRVVRGGDRREQPERAFGHGRQPRPRALHLLGERRLRPRQRIVADERPVADRGQHVGQQPVGRDRRLQLQRRLRESGAALFVARRAASLSAMRIRRTTPARVDASAAVARVEQRERHAVAVVDERRVAGEPLAAASRSSASPGRSPKSQRLEPAPLERRARLARTTAARPRPAARAAPRGRGPLASSRPAASTTRTLHCEMRGQRRAVPRVGGRRLAERAPQPARAARRASGSRPDGTASRNAVTASGSGVSRLRNAFGSAFR